LECGGHKSMNVRSLISEIEDGEDRKRFSPKKSRKKLLCQIHTLFLFFLKENDLL
jgi:hypothetical protein